MGKKYAGATRTSPPRSTEADRTGVGTTDVQEQSEGLAYQGLTTGEAADKPPTLILPKEMQEEARDMIARSFRNFADHSQRLTEGLAEFNRKREQVRREVERGARQTSGRIV